MNEQYKTQALAFESKGFTNPQRFAHGALGLVTELHEFVNANGRFNQIEELGDMAWFLTLCIDALASEQLHQHFTPVPVEVYQIEKRVIAIADFAKRWMFYGTYNPGHVEDVAVAIEYIMSFIASEAGVLGYNLQTVLNKNIAKLSARYPDKVFNADKALNRNVAGEYKAMEGQSND